MKKLLIGIITMGLLLAAGTGAVYAAGRRNQGNTAGTHRAEICNYTRTSCVYTDTKSANVCYNQETALNNDCRYTDENQDGICDNYTDKGCQQTGTRRGHGHGHRGNHHR